MAENNQNSLVTKIATYGSFIAIASFVILFISIFLKFSFNIEFTATIMNICRYTLILGFILMSLPDVVDKTSRKLYSMHLLSSSLSSFTLVVLFCNYTVNHICFRIEFLCALKIILIENSSKTFLSNSLLTAVLFVTI